MAYTSLSKVKEHLGITSTDYDTEIQALVDSIDDEIHRTLDVDGFASATTTETIRSKYVYYMSGYPTVYLKNFNVDSILEIDGEAYSGEYKVIGDRQVRFKDFDPDYEYGVVEIKYSYGYDTIPDDIKELAKLMVAVKFRINHKGYLQDGNINLSTVTDYSLGDESITFDKNVETKKQQQFLTDIGNVQKILGEYAKADVYL